MTETISADLLLIISIACNAVLLLAVLWFVIRGSEKRRQNDRIDILAEEMRRLQELFTAPKSRGGLGERLLYQLLEDTVPGKYWEQQYRFTSGVIADAVIKLGNYIIPIDSKFPREGISKLIETPALKNQAQATKEIRRHIDTIREKYIIPKEGTLQFALMYLPSEQIYYSLFLEEPSTLFDYALNARVIPVSPVTFFVYLQTIAYGLQGFAVSERGEDILKALAQMQIDHIESFRLLEKSEQHIRNAGNGLTGAKARFELLGKRLEELQKLEI